MNNAYLCKTYLEVWLKVAYHTSTNNKPTYHITSIHTKQKSNCCITFLKTKTLMSKLIHLQRILKQESSINNFSLYVCVLAYILTDNSMLQPKNHDYETDFYLY